MVTHGPNKGHMAMCRPKLRGLKMGQMAICGPKIAHMAKCGPNKEEMATFRPRMTQTAICGRRIDADGNVWTSDSANGDGCT